MHVFVFKQVSNSPTVVVVQANQPIFRVLCVVLSSRPQFLTNYYAKTQKKKRIKQKEGCMANFRKKREVRRQVAGERTFLQKTSLRLMEVIHFRTNCSTSRVKSKTQLHSTPQIPIPHTPYPYIA